MKTFGLQVGLSARSGAIGDPVINPPAPSGEGALTAFGDYTGSGTAARQTMTLPFTPSFVIVIPENADPVMWRNNNSWHGRTQFFHNLPSQYAIGGSSGELFEPFSGPSFQVTANANKAGVSYRWIAIAQNHGDDYQEVSYIGNAISPRTLDFSDAPGDVAFVKRDSSRYAIWRTAGAAGSFSSNPGEDSGNEIISLDTDGLTVSDTVSVNENSNTALGEGIEAILFRNGDVFEAQRFIGTGSPVTLTFGFPVAGYIILHEDNATAATPHLVWTAGMGSSAKPFNGNLRSAGITVSSEMVSLPSGYSRAGEAYTVLAIADRSGGTVHTESFDLSAAQAYWVPNGSVELSNFPALSGACSFEFFGEPTLASADYFHPILMLGNATAGSFATRAGTYNGGLYAFETDPDNNGWRGGALRVIHSDYLSLDRDEGSINYYNLNSGIIAPQGDVHYVVTHDGFGHWRLFVQGELIKDYNVDLSAPTYGGRTNGGAGSVANPAILFGGQLQGAVGSSFESDFVEPGGKVYRVAAWDGLELSIDQAKARFDDVLVGGASYQGPAPTVEYDFRGGNLPTGIIAPPQAQFVSASTPVQPHMIGAGPSGSAGSIAHQPDGSMVLTAENANGRALMFAPSGRALNLRAKFTMGDASTVIVAKARASDNGDSSRPRTELYRVQAADGPGIDRVDQVTLADGEAILFIAVMAKNGQMTFAPDHGYSLA
ncbi:MAG: hypothetical protein AAF788_03685 [Pseudomonadota bacterium]